MVTSWTSFGHNLVLSWSYFGHRTPEWSHLWHISGTLCYLNLSAISHRMYFMSCRFTLHRHKLAQFMRIFLYGEYILGIFLSHCMVHFFVIPLIKYYCSEESYYMLGFLIRKAFIVRVQVHWIKMGLVIRREVHIVCLSGFRETEVLGYFLIMVWLHIAPEESHI